MKALDVLKRFVANHPEQKTPATETLERGKPDSFQIGEMVAYKIPIVESPTNYSWAWHRGVVVDVDPHLMLTDEWYELVARSRPPKDQPWYRVLVHNAIHETYVAERNLEADTSGAAVRHPMIDTFFSDFSDGHYLKAGRMN